MARVGMTELIDRLRGMAKAGTADYTVGETTYWSDNQLQDVLERNRELVYREALHGLDTSIGDVTDYQLGRAPVEGTASGSAYFALTDRNDNVISGYTLDQHTGRIVFDSDTNGTVYYASYRVYDMERAAAEVWTEKSSQYAGLLNWSSDNHSVNRQQQAQAASQMANYWLSRAKPKSVRMRRNDTHRR